MKYLVLKPIRAYGKRYERGDFVDETQVRTPRILVGEHKITPVKAVSSSISPAEPAPIEASKEVPVEPAKQVAEEAKKPVKLSFKKKEE